jgi:multisubunit Na+/H+ antiporter MnhB subunit
MSHKSRMALVLVLMVIFSSVLVWVVFHPSVGLRGGLLIVGTILVLSLVPIYPLYRQLRKRGRPPSSALAILLLIGALASGLVYCVAALVLRLDANWILVLSELCRGLILASCVLFIWNGFVRQRGARRP